MKKLALIILLMGLFSASAVWADVQVEIGANVPAAVGAFYDNSTVTEELPVSFVIPDLMITATTGDAIKLGIGARVWSILVATAAYPVVTAEIDLDPIILQANLGGGLFAYSVIGEELGTTLGNVYFPEVSASFRLTDWFSIGVAALGLYVPELTEDGFVYAINIVGRFRIQ